MAAGEGKEKGLAALIVASKAAPKADGDLAMGDEGSSDDEGQLAAADELISAVGSGDAQAVLEAFKALKEMC